MAPPASICSATASAKLAADEGEKGDALNSKGLAGFLKATGNPAQGASPLI